MRPIGVLALQGDYNRHRQMLERLDRPVVMVRNAYDLSGIDGLVLPGGESTTIGRLMVRFELHEPVRKALGEGLPALATCAGAILLSKHDDDPLQFRLDVLDIDIERNAYGRQLESFETDLGIEAVGRTPFRAVFIRAPIVRRQGPDVEVLSVFEDSPVLLSQHNLLAATFHPELTDDDRVHRLFLDRIG